MQFADQQSAAIGWLVLRHLYDGDVIEWPIADDHPHQHIFVALESQGYIVRWDRVWPLHDRYRLTDRGIAAIESMYRPAGSQQFFEDLRRRNLSPVDRRSFLQQQRLDPFLWPLLHDPSLHWSTYGTTGSMYQSYFWEDQGPPRIGRAMRRRPGGGGGGGGRVVHHHHHHHHHNRPQHIVDLDEAARDPDVPLAPAAGDYDVS